MRYYYGYREKTGEICGGVSAKEPLRSVICFCLNQQFFSL